MRRGCAVTGDDSDAAEDFGMVDALVSGAAHGLAIAILPMLLIASWITLTTPERLEVLGAAMVLGAAANALRRQAAHRGRQ